MIPSRGPKLGLVLSGGGARGLAHIGVLRVLEGAGIVPDLLAGTSMGGLVAAFYAAGFRPDWMEREAVHLSQWHHLLRLMDAGFPGPGLVEGGRIRRYFEDRLGNKTFAELRLPTCLVAADLRAGCEVRLDQGSLVQAVMATIALPGVFPPVPDRRGLLVDGGVLNNLPVDVARDMGAEVVVAVDITPATADFLAPEPDLDLDGLSVVETLIRVTHLMQWGQDERRLVECRPEVLMRPDLGPEVTPLGGFSQARRIIEAGAVAAEAALPGLLALGTEVRLVG